MKKPSMFAVVLVALAAMFVSSGCGRNATAAPDPSSSPAPATVSSSEGLELAKMAMRELAESNQRQSAQVDKVIEELGKSNERYARLLEKMADQRCCTAPQVHPTYCGDCKPQVQPVRERPTASAPSVTVNNQAISTAVNQAVQSSTSKLEARIAVLEKTASTPKAPPVSSAKVDEAIEGLRSRVKLLETEIRGDQAEEKGLVEKFEILRHEVTELDGLIRSDSQIQPGLVQRHREVVAWIEAFQEDLQQGRLGVSRFGRDIHDHGGARSLNFPAQPPLKDPPPCEEGRKRRNQVIP
jgi:hypothetical protein